MAVSERLHRRTCALGVLLWLSIGSGSAQAEPDWHICTPFERRVTCIVDGDTLWFQGEKMRLYGVDTPEVDGQCPQERKLAFQATKRHLSLVQSGVLTITRHRKDTYGRTLVTIETRAGMVGQVLLKEGLADRFGDGVRANWCGT